MSQRSEQVLEELKSAYAAYYDVEGVHDGSALKALCSYHTRDSQYVLVKKAELWAAESHEYLHPGRWRAPGASPLPAHVHLPHRRGAVQQRPTGRSGSAEKAEEAPGI